MVEEPHRANNGYNVHLFDLIRQCGYTVEEFVQGYLSCLQPYSLSRYAQTPEGLGKFDYWVEDTSYRYSLLMKVRLQKQFDGLVISFHESNVGNIPLRGGEEFDDRLCAVFVDSAVRNGDVGYHVGYTVQHGFIRVDVEADTAYYYPNGVALVPYAAIREKVLGLLYRYIGNLYKVYSSKRDTLDVAVESLSDLSFMANGFATINNLCLFIDLYAVLPPESGKVVITFTGDILDAVPDGLRPGYLKALCSKYGVNYGNKLYQYIVSELEVGHALGQRGSKGLPGKGQV